ncbi:MAG TPA: hypothetical protein VI009_19765 [Xanthobacteraceae bacterium]
MTSDNETPSERYRRLARECLDVAYTFPDGVRRTVLVQMAQVWQRLADEQATMPSFSSGDAEQPAMQQQQQQQIQPDDDKQD